MNSMKKNKRHEIDDLFLQRLGELRMEPSLETRQKFLEQINRKRLKPIWYFSAAASVFVVCGFAWFLLGSGSEKGQHSVLSESVKPVQEENVGTENPIALESDLVNKDLAISKKNKAPNKQFTLARSNGSLKVSEAPVFAEINKEFEPKQNITGVIETDERIQDKLTLALQESEKRKEESKRVETINNGRLFQKSVGETVIIVASDIPKDSEIYVPEMNSDSPITLAEATDLGLAKMEEERSLFTKVFTELKHLKHGEGLNMNSITASNEVSILNNEDSFIGHETMQFRERYRWLKGKLSKE